MRLASANPRVVFREQAHAAHVGRRGCIWKPHKLAATRINIGLNA
jgi:hypothetical protein